MPLLPERAGQGRLTVWVLVLLLLLLVSPVPPRWQVALRLLVNFTATGIVNMASKVQVLGLPRIGGALQSMRLLAVLNAGSMNRFVYAFI